MKPFYVISVDLGQQQDYTAVSVIQAQERGGLVPTRLNVVHLERFPLKTPYTQQVMRVRSILEKLGPQETYLIYDQTGVGRGVGEMFKLAGVNAHGISIHSGDKVAREGSDYSVPKKDLVGAIQLAFMSGRLKIADLPETPALMRELENFKIKIGSHLSALFSAWRETDHDDLVMSVAMACWYCDAVRFKSGHHSIVGGSRR